jgi:hypothetical protein
MWNFITPLVVPIQIESPWTASARTNAPTRQLVHWVSGWA